MHGLELTCFHQLANDWVKEPVDVLVTMVLHNVEQFAGGAKPGNQIRMLFTSIKKNKKFPLRQPPLRSNLGRSTVANYPCPTLVGLASKCLAAGVTKYHNYNWQVQLWGLHGHVWFDLFTCYRTAPTCAINQQSCRLKTCRKLMKTVSNHQCIA